VVGRVVFNEWESGTAQPAGHFGALRQFALQKDPTRANT
jgi:hypothetical protein